MIRIAKRRAPRHRCKFRLEAGRDHFTRKLGGAIGNPGGVHRNWHDNLYTVIRHDSLHPNPLQMGQPNVYNDHRSSFRSKKECRAHLIEPTG